MQLPRILRRLSAGNRTALSTDSDDKKWASNLWTRILFSAVLLVILNVVSPETIPISSSWVWRSEGSVSDWVSLAKPIFAWGFGVTLLFGILRKLTWEMRKTNALHAFLAGLVISVFAGVSEEILFRWILFLPTVALEQFFNWVFSGVLALLLSAVIGAGVGAAFRNVFLTFLLGLGFPVALGVAFGGLPPGLPEWFHMNVWGPFADLTTGGHLKDYIFHSTGFAVGAAMLTANSLFRDGHKYQGVFGYLNSWFIGMFLFYVMFTFGLPAAILVHFLYDVVVFTTGSVVLAFRNDLPAWD